MCIIWVSVIPYSWSPNSIDDEIMGWKEEKRAQGWSEEDISRGLEEAYKAIKAQAKPSDIEGIKKRVSSEATGTPAELKVVDTESEPLVKYGHEAIEEKYPSITDFREGAYSFLLSNGNAFPVIDPLSLMK